MVRIFIKFSLTSGISDIKIGLKSGNPKEDVLLYGGSGMRCIPHILNNAFRPKCWTKFSDYVENHTVSAFLLMEKYSCSTELMFR